MSTNYTLRTITTLPEALELETLLARCASESMAEFQDAPLAKGAARAFLERNFGKPESLLLVAKDTAGSVAGLCATAPLIDPLLGESLPLIVLLWVDPGLRHRGLAHALVRETERQLVARGHKRLAGRVGHNDDALISMGERWGFVRQWELMLRE